MSQYVNLWMKNQKADENKQSFWILLNSYSRNIYTYDAISMSTKETFYIFLCR